jgi:hypothetical protein
VFTGLIPLLRHRDTPGCDNGTMRTIITTTALAFLLVAATACGEDEATEGSSRDTSTTTTVTTDATTSDSVVGQPAASDHATLDIAMTPGWDSIVEPFIADVDQRSAGSVSVGIDYDWLDAHQQNDVEQQIVDAVASGELDLGLVGTRAFKELGLTSFEHSLRHSSSTPTRCRKPS